MRLGMDRRYKKVSDSEFVDAEEPDSAARRLQRSLIRLDFVLREWRLVASTSGLPDGGEELPPFSFIEDSPPRLDLRLELSAKKRRFYAVKDGEAAIEVDRPIRFRIVPSKEGKTEGYVQHVPAWRHDEDGDDDLVHGALVIPAERMDWLVEQLARPNARLHVALHADLFKEEIALAFDRPWYGQDIALSHGERVPIRGYSLDVVTGPSPLDDEKPEPEEEDAFEADFSVPDEPAKATPPQAVSIADKRLDWILCLLAALVVIAVFRR